MAINWRDKVARGERPIWMPEDLDALEWTAEELEAAEKAIAPPRPSLVPAPARREGSTLFLMPKLVRQILGYQRDLSKAFDEMIAELPAAAGAPSNNQFTGFSEGDEEGEAAIGAAVVTMLGAAATAFAAAYQTGRAFGMGLTGRAVVSTEEQEIRLQSRLRRNASFVTMSLMADVREAYQEILRDPMLPPERAAAAVDRMGESMAGRVTMYATPLWGLGHQGFGEEMIGAGKLLDWVLTSTDPCQDCPTLEARGPYGALNPLHTYPGGGDTQCRTNCRCLLVERPGSAAAPPLPIVAAAMVRERMAPPDLQWSGRLVRELRREEITAMLEEYANKLLARRTRRSERSQAVQKGLEVMASQMGEGFKAMARAIEQVAAKEPAPIIVTSPDVHVAAAAPVVVPAPEVHVAALAPVVIPAPTVEVELPALQVHLPPPPKPVKMKRTPVRDERTREILYTVDEPVE